MWWLKALLLRLEELPVEARRSAASTIDLPTSPLLGFRRAEMASCSSASTSACFFALTSSRPVRLLLRDRTLGRSRGCCEPSALIMLFRLSGSLPSRFRPGIVVDVADLSKAIALLGPRETLRRNCCSVDNALWSVLGREGAGLLAAEPGFGSFLESCPLLCLALGGDTITGPPSFRLMVSQSSGKRGEKLPKVRNASRKGLEGNSQGHDDVDAKIL